MAWGGEKEEGEKGVSRVRDGTGSPGHGSAGHRVSNLGPGRVGSRVKAMTRLFDPDACSML